MKFDVIQTLQLACNGFTDPKMEEAYIQTPEADQADRLMMDAIAAGNLAELDELCSDVGNEREHQGFINGFRLGVRMMMECSGSPHSSAYTSLSRAERTAAMGPFTWGQTRKEVRA